MKSKGTKINLSPLFFKGKEVFGLFLGPSSKIGLHEWGTSWEAKNYDIYLRSTLKEVLKENRICQFFKAAILDDRWYMMELKLNMVTLGEDKHHFQSLKKAYDSNAGAMKVVMILSKCSPDCSLCFF